MQEVREVKRYFPKILIDAGPTPIAYLDTFIWGQILTRSDDLRRSLEACCKERRALFAITSAIEVELAQRNFLEDVRRLCTDSLVSVPVGRITANQIVHALVCYERLRSEVVLTWELALSEVPVLDHPTKGLRNLISNLADELNKAKQGADVTKVGLVSALVNVERETWRDNLRAYGDAFKEIDEAHSLKTGTNRATYETFFLTDYFTDLPVIVLRSYLFAYLLNERPLKPQDIIDIYTVSELVPYTKLFIMDRDQHNRIIHLQRDYPMVFGQLEKICSISSFLRNSRLTPAEALKAFLELAFEA